MTAVNHLTPSARWLETLIEAIKVALRRARVAPVVPRPAASNALPSEHPLSPFAADCQERHLAPSRQVNNQLVLPAILPARMLLLSADCGIATTMSMLRDLQARNYQGDVVLLHVCRNPAQLNQASALQGAADSYPELSLLVHFNDHAGPFCAEALALAVPDVKERSTWMCGPSGFMEMVQAYWRSQGLTVPLHTTTHPEVVTA